MAFWQGLSYGAQDQPYSYPTNGVTYNGSSKSIKIQDKRENQRKQQLLRQQKQTERLRQLQNKREEERVRQQRQREEREEREEREREERRQWERARREQRERQENERQENEILARTDPEMLRYYADRSPSIASRLESLGLLPPTPSTPSIPMNLEHITDPSLFEDMENTIDCGICMEPCTKDSIGILKCNHKFCVSCIKRQLSVTNNKCAYCRQHIDKITVYNDDSVKK